MEKIYLSVDLDYWTSNRFQNEYKKHMKMFLNKLLKIKIPIKVVLTHDKLINHVNESKPNVLINIDHHSDLVDWEEGEKREINEGTWVNFIKFRKNGEYIWVYPNEMCYSERSGKSFYRGTGRCDLRRSPFGKKSIEICEWLKTSRKLKKYNEILTEKQWENIVAAGISISPDWINKYIINQFLSILKEKNNLSKIIIEKDAMNFLNKKSNSKSHSGRRWDHSLPL